MTKQTSSDLLIKAGIVPKNALEQMVSWKMIDGEKVEQYGSDPISLEQDKLKAVRFVETLQRTIDTEDQDIKETELTPLKKCLVVARTGSTCLQVEAAVDQLGRVYLPYREGIENVESVAFLTPQEDTAAPWVPGEAHAVVRVEARHQGNRQVAWVAYLAGNGGQS